MLAAGTIRRDSSRLRPSDLEKLLEFLRRIYALSDLDSFRKQTVAGLQDLIPSKIIGYNEVDLHAQRNHVVYDRPEAIHLAQGDEIFDRHIAEHPLIDFCKTNPRVGAVAISDLLPSTRFHRLGLYNEFFRRLGIEDQMAISFPTARSVIVGVALNRESRNFTGRDRLLLNLVYPHLLQAYRNIRAFHRVQAACELAQGAAAEPGAAVIWLSNPGRAQQLTLRAAALLAKYFPGPPHAADALPEAVRRWVERELAGLEDATLAPVPRGPLVTRGKTGALTLRLISGDGRPGLLLEESPAAGRTDGPELTPRERDVLHWVTRGKTNRAISERLGITSRTVQKHVEHIFQKLGVRTRTAAAAQGFGLGFEDD